ncbi:type I polyketide synthase [Cellulomonas xiejunii]|uniref:type I polyketide synthase n=1 Tax=Cellulomonas xiejunii TaxID=2968083 RepID=UPI001D0E7850|nr:type I polyketide synthase [Cellulomonas xiejunii]MCC2314661.1 SDR family NAD(P)-dependent oxidoreductase [Cellulomonas xiejunii]
MTDHTGPAAAQDGLDERLARALRAVERLRDEAEQTDAPVPVAVTGIGLRLPDGIRSLDDLWETLVEGRTTASTFGDDRWPTAGYLADEPGVPGRTHVLNGHFLDQDPYAFDAELFGVNDVEALALDPQHRLALECLWSALECAGLRASDLDTTRTGVYFGQSTTDYARLRQEYGDRADINPYQMLSEPSFLAGRVSFMLGLHGPSKMIDTACSSALVALHEARSALAAGDISRAVVGGVNLMLSPYGFVLLDKTGALAPDGLCKTFSDRADGYGRGEGCVVVVLERLEDAIERGAPVLAVVEGSAVNHDGRSSGLSVPNGAAQRALLADALDAAAVSPGDIVYVEAHGTGTALGDPIEVGSIADVLAGGDREAPVLVGSVKSNVGHLEAASGLVGLVKTALVLQRGIVPPSVNSEPLNRAFTHDPSQVRIASRAEALGTDGDRFALVNSFGASGTNVSVVLGPLPETGPSDEEAAREGESAGQSSLVVLSAADDQALRARAEQLCGVLNGPDVDLTRVASTLAHGRDHLRHRLAVTGDLPAVRAELARWAVGERSDVVCGAVTGRAAIVHAFAFTGQGQQHAGMGAAVRRLDPAAAEVLERAVRVLPELEHYLAGPTGGGSPELEQPALVAVEVALATAVRARGIAPSVVLGHSLGEIAAAADSGMLPLEDALVLARARGAAMAPFVGTGHLLATSAGIPTVTEVCSERGLEVEVAAVNGASDVVLVGAPDAITELRRALAARGLLTKILAGDLPFHSSVLRATRDVLEPAVRRARFRDGHVPMTSTLTGRTLQPGELADPAYWIEQVSRTVKFADAVATATQEHGVTHFIEVGPGRALSVLGWKGSNPGQWATTYERPGSTDGLLRLAGRVFTTGEARLLGTTVPVRPLVPLPPYPFNHDRSFRFPVALAAAGADVDRRSAGHADDVAATGYEITWDAHDGAGLPDAVTGPSLQAVTVIGVGPRPSGLAERLRALLPETVVSAAGWDADLSAVSGVVLLDATADVQDGSGHEAVQATRRLVRVLRRLGPDVRSWLVTRRTVATRPVESVPGLWAAPAWGVACVAALERADRWGGAVDLDGHTRAALTALMTHVQAGDAEDQAVVREGRVLVPRLVPASPRTALHAAAPRSDGAYLVTGGTGGLGAELGGWLVEQGAAHLVLLSRRGEQGAAPDTRDAITRWRAAGVRVDVLAVDVADRDATLTAVAEVVQGTDVAGIVHAAGASEPALLDDLDDEGLRASLIAKTVGGATVRALAVQYVPDLVVLYSSVASVWGSVRLTGYAAANRYLDGLAADLSHLGVPTVAISWGPWLKHSGLGGEELLEHLLASGLRPVEVAEGLRRLSRWWGATGHVVEADVDWERLVGLMEIKRPRPMIAGLREQAAAATGERDDELVARLREADDEGRHEVVADLVRGLLAAQLRVDRSVLTEGADLVELGLESIGVMEVVGRLGRTFGVTFAAGDFFDVPAPRWGELVLTRLEVEGVLPPSERQSVLAGAGTGRGEGRDL